MNHLTVVGMTVSLVFGLSACGDDAPQPQSTMPAPDVSEDAPPESDSTPDLDTLTPDTPDTLSTSDVSSDPDDVTADVEADTPWDVFETTATGCNGRDALCDRRYDEVAFLCAHNAMSNTAAGFLPPNHHGSMRQQLAEGVRAMMLDTYLNRDGERALCHGYCTLGERPLRDGLQDIKDFLDAHPREVFSILFESHISDAETVAALQEVELDAYVYAREPGQPWPTLGSMVASGRRLVVFTESGGGDPAWYHPLFGESFDTPFHAETPEAFTCEVGRGNETAEIFVLNHFLTAPYAKPELAELVNYNPFLIERARACEARYGRLPNFIALDFYALGDGLAAVDALNGF